jgi:alkaline phosphatase D
MKRRSFLRLAGATPLALPFVSTAGCTFAAPDHGALPGDPISMGPWPARPGADRMSIFCEATPGALASAQIVALASGDRAIASFTPLEGTVELATFGGLEPDTEYAFTVHTVFQTVHEGSFRTLPRSEGLVRIALGSDIHPGSAPYASFERIEERLPHVFVGLGDQVYADRSPLGPVGPYADAYDALYRRAWREPSLRSCWSHVPSVLVWDDHDIWNNFDGTMSPERFSAARSAYTRYQRSRSEGTNAWSILDLGPASMFIADTRSFRSPNGARDDPEKTMLGEDQLEALLAFIADTRAGFRILVSPTPFHRHADTRGDAWAHGFARERETILRAISEADPDRLVIVSGDQHWPAVVLNRLNDDSYVTELQCTPLAAFRRPPPRQKSPDLLYVGDGSPGFGWIEVDGCANPPTLRFAWVDAEGNERYVLER